MNNPEEWNACIEILHFSECLRKSARGEVTVRSPGTGLITINNQSIEYFEHMQDREQVGCTSL
jgi:small subunit ribosomal protein S9